MPGARTRGALPKPCVCGMLWERESTRGERARTYRGHVGSSRCVAVLLRPPSACFRVRCVVACIPSSNGVLESYADSYRSERECTARVRLVVVGSSRRWVVGARVWAGGAGWGLVSECIHTYMQLGNPPKSRSKCTFNTTPPCQRGVNVGLKKFLTEGRRASRTVPFYGLSAN